MVIFTGEVIARVTNSDYTFLEYLLIACLDVYIRQKNKWLWVATSRTAYSRWQSHAWIFQHIYRSAQEYDSLQNNNSVQLLS